MASVTLVWSAGHINPEPNIDTAGRINSVIVKRRNGSEYTDTDTDGPLGTVAIGAYRQPVNINPATDDVLPQHAHYHRILGTDPDPRFPRVVVDLTARPDLTSAVAAIDVGGKLELRQIPEDLGQPEADLMALGYTEVIGTHSRKITFNTRPGGILFNVGVLDGGAAACLQTAGAQLSSSITAEQVSFSVATTSGPLLTTSPPAGAKIVIRDREVMTVTAVSGASSPQTVTVVRDPAQRMTHPSAATVKVYRPLRLTL